jgi:hypothetical protein
MIMGFRIVARHDDQQIDVALGVRRTADGPTPLRVAGNPRCASVKDKTAR